MTTLMIDTIRDWHAAEAADLADYEAQGRDGNAAIAAAMCEGLDRFADRMALSPDRAVGDLIDDLLADARRWEAGGSHLCGKWRGGTAGEWCASVEEDIARRLVGSIANGDNPAYATNMVPALEAVGKRWAVAHDAACRKHSDRQIAAYAALRAEARDDGKPVREVKAVKAKAVKLERLDGQHWRGDRGCCAVEVSPAELNENQRAVGWHVSDGSKTSHHDRRKDALDRGRWLLSQPCDCDREAV